ncbi:MAG: hypothetical protein C5B50_24690 [Verrucomicrobia bacterium]|nr:MAG: hypothetical protein C5B50_24690 [Verrucomicrobiota bacterium]
MSAVARGRLGSIIQAGVVAFAALLAIRAVGQARLEFSFHGATWTTNSQGKIISRPSNNKTWLQDFASQNGLSTNGLGLAYHLNGSVAGDQIEVINATTGDVITALYGLYKTTSDGRTFLTNNNGTQLRAITFVYGNQLSHSVGSVLLNEKYFLDENGNTNRTVFQGQMHFILIGTNSQPMTIYSGTFVTGKLLPGSTF